MSTIVTRAGKGTALTWTEMDANFTNLNTDKIQAGDNVTLGTVTVTTINASTYQNIPLFNGTVDGLVNAGSNTGTQFLRDDGTWAVPAGTGGTPGGADTNVQYNDAGAFGGEAAFAYNKTTNTLTVENISMTGSISTPLFVSATGLIGDYLSLNQPGSAPVRGWYTPSTTEMRGNIATTNILNMKYDASYSFVVGVGVVPAAWSNTILPVYAVEIGDRAAVSQFSGGMDIGWNTKVDSAYAYVARSASGTPALLTLSAGTAVFKMAASNPGAGNAITFVSPLTVSTSGISVTGDVVISGASIPQNSQSADYTLVAADANKHILHPSADTTARVFTIPANASVAYSIGTAITFVNQNSAGTITIAITSDTMRLAGAGTTGSRTLAANGVATALKITSTEWIISGTGLT